MVDCSLITDPLEGCVFDLDDIKNGFQLLCDAVNAVTASLTYDNVNHDLIFDNGSGPVVLDLNVGSIGYVPGTHTIVYTNEEGNNTNLGLGVGTLQYLAGAHDLNYIKENGATDLINLNVGSLAYNPLTHDLDYTREDGTNQNINLNKGVLSYQGNPGFPGLHRVTYVDEEAAITNLDLNIGSLAYTAPDQLTYTRETGSTQVVSNTSRPSYNVKINLADQLVVPGGLASFGPTPVAIPFVNRPMLLTGILTADYFAASGGGPTVVLGAGMVLTLNGVSSNVVSAGGWNHTFVCNTLLQTECTMTPQIVQILIPPNTASFTGVVTFTAPGGNTGNISFESIQILFIGIHQ